jgi:hypothetical protein
MFAELVRKALHKAFRGRAKGRAIEIWFQML